MKLNLKNDGIKFGTKSNFMSVTFVLAGSTPATMKLIPSTPNNYCALRAGGSARGAKAPLASV